MQPRPIGVAALRGHPPVGHRGFLPGGDAFQRREQNLAARIDQTDLQPRSQCLHNYIANPVTTAPKPQTLHRRRDRRRQTFRHKQGAAFGHKGVAQPPRFGRVDEIVKGGGFKRQPLLDWQHLCRLDTIDDPQCCWQACARKLFAPRHHRRTVSRRIAQTIAAICGAARRLADKGCGISDGVVAQIAFDHPINQPDRQGLRCSYRLAFQHDLQRGARPHQSRQPLGAARAGQNAQMHLGQAHLRCQLGQPHMCRQCKFQPTPHRMAIDCGHHRFGEILDHGAKRAQGGLICAVGFGTGLAKFGHIRARRKLGGV